MFKNVIAAIFSSILLLGIVACEPKGPAERAGEDVDNAVDSAGDALEDAGDDVEDATDG